jgi:hypothetical protein
MIALAVAVIMTVLDATRSIAADALVTTPLGVSWAAVSPDTLDRLRQTVTENLPPFVWDPVLIGLLRVPGFAVFAALAMLLAAAGRRPQRPAMRFGLQR